MAMSVIRENEPLVTGQGTIRIEAMVFSWLKVRSHDVTFNCPALIAAPESNGRIILFDNLAI